MATTCSAAELDAVAPEGEACLSRWWWRSMLAAGIPPGGVARMVRHGTAVLPVLERPGRAAQSLTGPYTVLFRPLLPADASDADWRAAGAGFARALRPVLVLEAVEADAAWLAPFLDGARAAGMRAARFDHFGNWHEEVGGRRWADYLAERPGKLREAIRRRSGRAAFSLVTGGEALAPGIAAYEDVYARSWKVAEPLPLFNPTLMREAAAAGALRLGLLRAEGQVIAAQLWTVAGGTASVMKLAHDEAYKALSPGTVLTARMIAHLLDVERVAALDFGRGDDPYKQLWTTRRRQRIGIVLAWPWHPAGAAALLRQGLGGVLRRWRG